MLNDDPIVVTTRRRGPSNASNTSADCCADRTADYCARCTTGDGTPDGTIRIGVADSRKGQRCGKKGKFQNIAHDVFFVSQLRRLNRQTPQSFNGPTFAAVEFADRARVRYRMMRRKFLLVPGEAVTEGFEPRTDGSGLVP
jgi:hypothetical protein